MKKQLVLGALAVVLSAGSVFAQDKMKMPSPEERTAATIEKMAPLNLKADQAEKVKVTIAAYYNDQHKALEEMRASGNMDREAMKTKGKELSDKRDAELKMILTEEQYKKWLEEIEPTTRPQRGPKPGAN